MEHFADRLRFLRGVSIFAATSDDVLTWVAASLVPVSVAAGTTIVTKGEPGDSMYLVAEGQAGAYDGHLLLNYLTVGDIFGEMALLDAQPRSASVLAVENTKLYRLDQRHFNDLMAGHGEVARMVIQALCQRIRAASLERCRDFAYIRQVALIAAAAQDLESGDYAPDAIREVAQRTDTLGHLARVFQKMALEVIAREQSLQRQVHALRIEVDQVRQARQVDEIVGSDYFQDLRQRAAALRNDLADGFDDSPHSGSTEAAVAGSAQGL